MIIRYLVILFFLLTAIDTYTCNSCGGGTGDLAVLSLDGTALINLGFVFDNYTGVWDKNGMWRRNDYSQSQFKTILNAAYRISRHLQFAVALPFVSNKSNIPGLKKNGTGIGDLILGSRYEFTHEYQPKKNGNKVLLDTKTPYTALTFGLVLPTGVSEETALDDVDITGKGFFTTSLGFSATKSIIRSRLQIIGDFYWLHSFEKSYSSIYGVPVSSEYTKKTGDKFIYSMSLFYMLNNWHALTLSAAGFAQNDYEINGAKVSNSDEKSLNFILSYTYYTSVPFRITTSVKMGIPSDNLGRNVQGSTSFNLFFTYYFSDLN